MTNGINKKNSIDDITLPNAFTTESLILENAPTANDRHRGAAYGLFQLTDGVPTLRDLPKRGLYIGSALNATNRVIDNSSTMPIKR
jgi:hypothetical protein